MVVPSYLKLRKRRAFSEHQRAQDQISFRYKTIKDKVASKFHSWNKHDSRQIDKSTLDFVIKYDLLSLERDDDDNKKIQELMKPIDFPEPKPVDKPSMERLNWKRGRIVANAISILLIEGVIVEKVYITNKGKKILVKRNELGIFQKLGFNFA